jgi:hypothetical protein
MLLEVAKLSWNPVFLVKEDAWMDRRNQPGEVIRFSDADGIHFDAIDAPSGIR